MDPSSDTRNAFTTRAIQLLSNRPQGSKSVRTSLAQAESSGQANEAVFQRAQSTPRQQSRKTLAPYRSIDAVDALVSPWVGARNVIGPSRSPAGSPRTKRRLALRPSLFGTPQIKEMSLEKGADLVCEVAGDFMARLVREVLEPGQGKDWTGSWGILQSLKRSNLFPLDGPLFLKAQDVIYDLPDAASITDRPLLERAIHLSNLATFTYIILCPDEAESLLKKYEDDPTDPDFPPRRSQRGVLPTVAELVSSVTRRNAALMKAWKAFWSVLISREKRTSPEAVKLWLELSTQLALTHQCPTIDPPSDPVDDLPPLTKQVVDQLLADDAVQIHGEFIHSLGESDAESVRELDGEYVQRRWSRMAAGRKIELEQASVTDLMDHYPYIDFAHDIAVYVQAQLSGMDVQLVTWDSPSQTPNRFSSPGSLPSTLHPNGSPSQLRNSSVRPQLPHHRFARNPSARMDWTSPEPVRPDVRTQLQPSPSIKERIDGMPIDMDLLSSMVGDLDAQFQSSQHSTPAQAARSPRTTRRPGSTQTPLHHQIEDDEWTVRESNAPTASPARSPSNRFTFSARQEDATRVEWESQSPGRRPTLPHLPRKSVTARASRKPKTGNIGPATSRLGRSLPASGSESLGLPHVTSDPEDVLPSDSQLGTPPRSIHENDFEEEDLLPSASQMETQARTGHEEIEYDHDDLLPSESQLGTPTAHRVELELDVDDVLPTDSQMETQARDDYEAELDLDDLLPGDSQLGSPLVSPDEDDLGVDDILPSASQLETQARKTYEVEVEAEDDASLEIDVVMPSASQLETQAWDDQGEEDLDVEDIVPSESQLNPSRTIHHGHRAHDVLAQVDEDDGMVDVALPMDRSPTQSRSPVPPKIPSRLPTSQRRLYSSRVDRSGDALEFEETNSDEDEEDRMMLRRGSPREQHGMTNGLDMGDFGPGGDGLYDDVTPLNNDFRQGGYDQNDDDLHGDSRQGSIAPDRHKRPATRLRVFDERDHNFDQSRRVSPSKLAARRSPPSPRRGTRAPEIVVPARRAPLNRATSNPYEPDPHMVDDDGNDLDEDPTFVLPQGYKFEPSVIHGRKDGQLSSYSRLAGGLRWTKDQELLLYRTIQKVPLVESYPTKVMWYLHGEYGKLSRSLEQFNPQHMKDKMRTIVETRVRNNRPVVGRARHWLAKSHPDKAAFEQELKEYWYNHRGVPENVEEIRAQRFMGEVREPKKRKKKAKGKKRRNEPEEEEEDDDEVQEDEVEDEDVVQDPNVGEEEVNQLEEDEVKVNDAEEVDDEDADFVHGPKRARRSSAVVPSPASTRKSARKIPNKKGAALAKTPTRSRLQSTSSSVERDPSPPPATRTRSRQDKAPTAPLQASEVEEAPTRQLRSSAAPNRSNTRSRTGPRTKDAPSKAKSKKKEALTAGRTTRSKSSRGGALARDQSIDDDDNNDELEHEKGVDGHEETLEASENVRRAMIRRRVNDDAA